MLNKKNGFITIPGAIIIAAAIIAIALIVVNKPASDTNSYDKANNQSAPSLSVKAISKDDMILGNPNAQIKIVEYSDPSCPFCRSFHGTMEKVMGKYGESGNVAWVYRHFPLDIHPNAVRESMAIECARSIGGAEKGWSYLKKIYTTPGPDGQITTGVDPKEILNIANTLELNTKEFEQCLSSGKFKEKVESDFASGVNALVSGTPTNFFVLNEPASQRVMNGLNALYLQYKLQPSMLYLSSDKKILVATGALPYVLIETVIDLILSK